MAGITRRSFVATGGALLATKGLAETNNVNADTTTEQENDVTGVVRHNISSFRALDWQPYFDTLKNGAILVDISSRALHYWSQDEQTYRLFPTSVPLPPGPDNPLGTHALWLGWTYYRIHGTHDTRKIGRRSSNGCIGLYNEHIAQLFELTKVGTQVLLI